MTDDSQSTTNTTPAGDDKNPLDILEELLRDSGGSGGGAAGGPAEPAKPEEPAEPTPEEKAKAREEIEQKMADQAVVDAQHVAEQQELLKSLKDTPQYQARVHQDQEKAENSQANQVASDGFEIDQLEHDKI